MLQLHQGKAILIMLGKAREMNITHTFLILNLTIMKEEENEIYLGDSIDNSVKEDQNFDKAA